MRCLWCFLIFFLAIPAYARDLTLSSKAFADGITIPVLYTCDGKDISPDLYWSNAPAKAKSFAIVFSDKDAPGGIFYHWVLFNIPANTENLPQAMTILPAGTIAGKNSWNKNQYNGPCPPKGALHHYTFTLYALDHTLMLPKSTDAPALLKSMEDHIIEQTTLNVGYARWPT